MYSQSADALSACTLDYLHSLQVQHNRILRSTGREARTVRAASGNLSEVDLPEINGNGSLRITEALRSDDTTTSDPAEIEATFLDHFRLVFSEPDPAESRADPALVRDLC